MRRWGHANKDRLAYVGTVDDYANGRVEFLTQIATTGDVAEVTPSLYRAMAITLLQNLDMRNVEQAFEALAEIELGSFDNWATVPDTLGTPFSLTSPSGDHSLMPIELDIG